MALSQISGPCREATRLCLSNNFNALIGANASAFGVLPVQVDWNPDTSQQYFQVFATPDDLEDSTAYKFPVVFHYALNTVNVHEQVGVQFAGQVTHMLVFYFSDKSSKLSRKLEKYGDLLEAVINQLFHDGNWPQLFGANAVCGQYPMRRSAVVEAAESWQQTFTFQLVFTAVSN